MSDVQARTLGQLWPQPQPFYDPAMLEHTKAVAAATALQASSLETSPVHRWCTPPAAMNGTPASRRLSGRRLAAPQNRPVRTSDKRGAETVESAPLPGIRTILDPAMAAGRRLLSRRDASVPSHSTLRGTSARCRGTLWNDSRARALTALATSVRCWYLARLLGAATPQLPR
jgi:hypothetical protein